MADQSLTIVSFAIVLFSGIIAGRVAENYNFPKTIPLILTGILIAVVSNLFLAQLVIDIESIRDMAILTAELALITVLFKEGMHLKLRQFRRYLFIIGLIAIFATILTTVIVGFMINISLGLSLSIALLVGAIFTPTDPAATFSALRSGGKNTKIEEKFETILGGESALNDVIAIILVVVILIPAADGRTEQGSIVLDSSVLFDALWQFFGGILLGLVVGFITLRLINRLPTRTEEAMISLGGAVLIFGLGFLTTTSSAIGALVAGIVIGNPRLFRQKNFVKKDLFAFWDDITFIFEIVAFVFIGAIFSVREINQEILLFSIALSILVLVGRFAGIFIITSILELFSKTRNELDNSHRLFIGFAGMKGLTTGILAILAFVALGEQSDIGQLIIYSSILVIIFTGLFQGLLLQSVASKTGVLEEYNELDELLAKKSVLGSSLNYLITEYDKNNIDSSIFNRLSLPLKEELKVLEERLMVFYSEREKAVKFLNTAIEMNQKAIDELEKSYNDNIIKNDVVYEKMKEELENTQTDLKIIYDKTAQTSYGSDVDKTIEKSLNEMENTLSRANTKLKANIKSFLSTLQESKKKPK